MIRPLQIARAGLVVLFAWPAIALAQTARDSPAQPASPVGTASIAGRVIADDASAQPLRRARVLVQPTPAQPQVGWTATTDDNGRYVVQGLPAGRYAITASKPAWMSGAYGARRPGRAGTPVALAAGQQLSNVDVRLPRGAVITGTVYDPSGQPAAGVSVSAMRYSYSTLSGQRMLGSPTSGSSVITDDRGVYRAYGLPAGEYVIVATPRVQPAIGAATEIIQIRSTDVERVLAAARAADTTGGRPTRADVTPRAVAYAPVLHPGTTDPTAATAITVGVGDERTGVNVALALVPTATLTGSVTLPLGVGPETVQVALTTPRSATGIPAYALSSVSRLDPSGRYQFRGLSPGPYVVTARVAPGSVNSRVPATTAPWSAVMETAIDGLDVDLPLELKPGVSVSGRVVFEGQRQPPAGDALGAMEIRLVTVPRGPSIEGPIARPGPDGRFVFTGVVPGRYSTLFMAAPGMAGWSLELAVVSGRDVRDAGLDVRTGENIADWVWTFTDQPAEISGTLQDASGRPASEYFVVVFAVDRSQPDLQSRRVRQTRPALDGAFSVTNLPPGDYLIAALTDLEPQDVYDPSFLKALEPVAVKVTVRKGEKTVQNLAIK